MHQVVGYDRDTERVGLEYGIPQQDFDKIKQIVGVASSDPDAVGNYEIDGPAVQEVARIIGEQLDTKRFDFFLEPVPEAKR